ncbi:hypothetical protein [Methylomonas sp. AM2-LC]|uniref:hypothetical protein n=1 Tax=Methylomonas sp. AM2-LC TaxID=3153301 RepID=UPI0032648578
MSTKTQHTIILNVLEHAQNRMTAKQIWDNINPADQGFFAGGVRDVSAALCCLRDKKHTVENGDPDTINGVDIQTYQLKKLRNKDHTQRTTNIADTQPEPKKVYTAADCAELLVYKSFFDQVAAKFNATTPTEALSCFNAYYVAFENRSEVLALLNCQTMMDVHDKITHLQTALDQLNKDLDQERQLNCEKITALENEIATKEKTIDLFQQDIGSLKDILNAGGVNFNQDDIIHTLEQSGFLVLNPNKTDDIDPGFIQIITTIRNATQALAIPAITHKTQTINLLHKLAQVPLDIDNQQLLSGILTIVAELPEAA